MLQLLATFLSKVVDILLKRADLKKDEVGPLRFYELYITLREILRGAKAIQKELRDSISSDYHVPHIALEIKEQGERLTDFTNMLWGLLFYVEIFDSETHRELESVVGAKLAAICFYYEVFERIDQDHLIIEEWDAHDITALADRFRIVEPEAIRRSAHVKAATYDLRRPADLSILLTQATENIAQIESSLEKLAGFIKANCALNDLFPKAAPFGWHR